MKNLFLFISILFCSVTNAAEPPVKSILMLQGEVIDTKATVIVFQYDKINCHWQRIEEEKNVDYYNIVLDPEEAYQIWFSSNNGFTKILYVDPGDKGLWNIKMNIDFSITNQWYAYLKQVCEQDISYSISFLKEHQLSLIPANNYCYPNLYAESK